MNFGLDETQKAFERLAKDFLDRECDSQVVRQAEETEAGFSAQLYQRLADQGLLGLNIDEEFGGSAVGYTEIVLFASRPAVTCCQDPMSPCSPQQRSSAGMERRIRSSRFCLQLLRERRCRCLPGWRVPTIADSS